MTSINWFSQTSLHLNLYMILVFQYETTILELNHFHDLIEGGTWVCIASYPHPSVCRLQY